MNTIGFVKSSKENENRRALNPEDIIRVKHKTYIIVEEDYGKVLGFTNSDYINAGIKVLPREEVLKCDIVCDPKIGDADYLEQLKAPQTIFGWIHATQNEALKKLLIDKKLTAIAWENMFDENRHIFWKNNEIAGEAAVRHAIQCYGMLPNDLKVAILGRGNTGRGAYHAFLSLGADIKVYGRRTEKLFKKELGNYNMICNTVLWDLNRRDHIINKDDLKRLKKGALIIDVSCDEHGAIETTVPTSIEDPIYTIDGIVHYAVDHTPSIFYKTISKNLSKIISSYLDILVEGKLSTNKVLKKAIIIKNGEIIDQSLL